MCEESACLVPPLESVQNGPSDPRLSISPGNGGVPHSGEALVGFHEDALSQAAIGKAQILLAVVLGVALAADCSELTMLGFILPSAELHLCIDEQKKGWLVSITLLSMAGGSFVWGILGDHLGRRRALISALSVAALFSAVAAVMPTYGTFMTARFGSGLGISGAFPLAFSYLAETCSRTIRARYLGFLHSMWPLGAIFTATLSHTLMPTVGVDIVQDNREHWSSWHRFLIISIVPILACIVGLVWASESPRYLLEASREVEALEVYQRLHRLNKARTQYGLTELELPGRSAYRERPLSPSRNVFAHGLGSFREAFQKLSSPTHLRSTLLLASVHFLLGFLYMGLCTFSTSLIADFRHAEYSSHTKYMDGVIFTGTYMNDTVENMEYRNSIFRNVTFTHINLNHVEFINCTVEDAQFINVKASVTFFRTSVIKDSRFIDTDFTDPHFIDCVMANNTFLSLISDCGIDFDYNNYLEDLYHETLYWAGFMIPVLFLTGFAMETVTRVPVIVSFLALAAIVSCVMVFAYSALVVSTLELLVKVALMSALNGVTLVVVEAYPCHLRCTAHGLLRALFHLACMCAIPIYTGLARVVLLIPAVVSTVVILFAIVLSTAIQDNSKVLL